MIRAQDGTARQVTRDKLRHWSPSWSGDGRTLYFERQSLRGGPSVLSVPVEGGTPRLLWEGAGIFLVEVPGRNLLVYGKDDQLGLFARSLAGDPSRNPELHLANDYLAPMGGLSPFHDGVYYVGYSPDGLPRAFRFYSFEKGKSIDIAPAPPNLQLGMTVSPDRSRLIYAVEKHGGQDLVQLDLK